MNNLLSEAYLTAERFIIFQNLNRDQNLQKDLLTKEFQNRYLEDWFFKDANKEIERLESIEIKEWEDHLHLFQLHRRIYHHPNQNPRMQFGDVIISKMEEQNKLVYLLEKAYIINEKIFRKRIIKSEDYDLQKDLKTWREVSNGVNHFSIELYRIRFEYTEENLLENYIFLRKLFLERFEELSIKEQKVHLYSLINDSSKLSRARLLDITASLPLYKIGLKTGIIFNNKKLTQTTYMTIVIASNVKKDFIFTDKFIKKYTTYLDHKIQDDAFNWAMAHKTYRMEKLSECLDILLKHDFKIFQLQLLTKSLTTQVYFDLHLENNSYQPFLFNYFDSFEKWLNREKFRSENFKTGFLKFIQKTRALAKHYSENDFQSEKVKNLLEGETNVQGSKWLGQRIEKVLDLKK